jgi:hypothetical protein
VHLVYLLSVVAVVERMVLDQAVPAAQEEVEDLLQVAAQQAQQLAGKVMQAAQ